MFYGGGKDYSVSLCPALSLPSSLLIPLPYRLLCITHPPEPSLSGRIGGRVLIPLFYRLLCVRRHLLGVGYRFEQVTMRDAPGHQETY